MEDNYRKHGRCTGVVVGLFMLIIIFLQDDIQQRRVEMVESAYCEMEEGNYEVALMKFYLYKHDCSILYWKLLELFGDGEDFCYEKIENAIQYCENRI